MSLPRCLALAALSLVMLGCGNSAIDSADTSQPAVLHAELFEPSTVENNNERWWPLPQTSMRPTPLHFGLFVTPNPSQNPIDPPERFTGFHAATDFEILTGEEDTDVPVFAICSGEVAYSGFVEGYGGLLVQRCRMNDGDVTVLYGHLRIDPLPEEGRTLRAGEQISLLADGRSYESGGNRKHLHLGIRRGKKLDIRGYVQQPEELAEYIDPQTILPL